MNIFEYEKAFTNAINEGDTVLEILKSSLPGLTEEQIVLHNSNYDTAIYGVEKNSNNLQKGLVNYKYDKMSREEFSAVLNNLAQGRPATLITISKEHKLSTLDTPQLLSFKYGLPIEDILSHNNVTIAQFEDMVAESRTLLIPKTVNIRQDNKYANVPVFGSISLKKVMGADLPNELVADSTGDLQVLDNEGTLLQGVKNLFGEEGDIPGYEEFLIDLDWGSDYASVLIDQMLIVKIEDRFLNDPRIKSVDDIIINTKGNGKTITLYLTAINNEDSIKVEV